MTALRDLSTPMTTFPYDEKPARTVLPSRVYLKDTDDAEQVLTKLELLHTRALEEWGDRERERFFQRATRYLDDDLRPEFPHILRSVTHQTAPRYAVLPNGQRVRWVGTQRIETLCHIRYCKAEALFLPGLQDLKRRALPEDTGDENVGIEDRFDRHFARRLTFSIAELKSVFLILTL